MSNASSWHQRWSQARTTLLNLLFPPRCVHCRDVGSLLCTSCFQQIMPLTGPLCARCGRPLPRVQMVCAACRGHPLEINGLRVVAPFGGVLQKVIHHFKYLNVRELAEPLGDLLLTQMEDPPLPVDVIVPVPLHKKRERERGYNQAALLARRLAQHTGLPLAERSLRRIRQTPPQVGLPASERWANVAGAFVCTDPDIAGRHPLLVDDVCTTGATLAACARALREGGAETVYAITLARPL